MIVEQGRGCSTTVKKSMIKQETWLEVPQMQMLNMRLVGHQACCCALNWDNISGGGSLFHLKGRKDSVNQNIFIIDRKCQETNEGLGF